MKALIILLLLTVVAQAQQPTAIRIPREDALRYLAGGCFPRAPQESPDGVPIILTGLYRPPFDKEMPILFDGQEVAHALILALGAVPESQLIEVEDEIPAGFRDLGVKSHRGHHPFRPQRLVAAPVKPVKFCEAK